MLVWRRGTPISQAFTREAKRSEQSDSLAEEASGEMFTNIKVFESPPRHGCLNIDYMNLDCPKKLKDEAKESEISVYWEITWRRYVSFEFLNGTWSSFFAKANITSLKDDKLLLMAWIQVLILLEMKLLEMHNDWHVT